jgi:twitching motility protein PilT
VSVEQLRIEELLRSARSRNATDLHAGGAYASIARVDGRLDVLDGPPLAPGALEAFVTAALPPEAAERFARTGTADAGRRDGPGAPYRLHVYRTTGGIRIAIRLLNPAIPALDQLALPAVVASFTARPNGLVLFTGPTGSGKTTALAALIDRINQNAERVILTVEDPVEYVHAPARSVIAHCEIGRDVVDYAEALRGFLRADPDVILVGEMRDRPTMEAALTAAETGHLVFSTLHTNDAPQAIDRIVDAFPSEAHPQIRTQLAATLVGVVALRLAGSREGFGRYAAAEVLIATDAVRAMIRDGKTHLLRNAISTGRASGMQTLETHLSDLVVRGAVGIETARSVANRPAEVRELERGV